MQKDIKVSIIVPIYNVEQYLCRCLDSLTSQTTAEIEIICIDDASADNSWMIVTSYAAKDKRIRLLRSSGDEMTPRNLGQSVARNIGIREAVGEYILMVDADDWLEIDAAEQLYELAKCDDLDILYFDFFSEYENEKLQTKYENDGFDFNNFSRTGACLEKTINDQEMMALQFETHALIGTVWSAIFKRKFLLENSLKFNEQIRMEDSLFSFQAMLCAHRTKCVSRAFYHYYRRLNSVTTEKFEARQLKDLFLMAVGELHVALSCEKLSLECANYAARWIAGDFSFAHKMWNANFISIAQDELHFAYLWQRIAFETFRSLVKPEPALHSFTSGELRLLRESSTIVIYGAGYVARRTLAYLHQKGIDEFKVGVSRVTGQQFFMGNKIHSIYELCKNNHSCLVLLAAMPDKQDEMREVLNSMNVETFIPMINQK